ncbi:nuclear transport factor 2 family protein [Microbacterium protaetiae]|uniref:Nuclear transport factor 2 family protein n=1 Tax=Microbacterium protaetiae TaxID=2509458 RepID=A0A4P6EC75_9MICO|nr:nuclear transport factor 2 family protein [Microbacterium protaetiae]QAY59832.1 nuclear transport factor 2 family protein [Microbacterium protaetiae]
MSGIHPADQATRAELLEVEARRRQALIDGDIAALDDLFDDSLVHIHAPGLVHDKAHLLEHVAARRAYLDMWRGELNMRVAGDIAVVTGELTNRMRAPGGGERTLSGPVTQVLHRGADGAWRYVSFQMTPHGDEVWGKLPSEQDAANEEDSR